MEGKILKDEFKINISVPVDNQGYALLQCSHCGDYFKVQPKDFEDEKVLNIHCPSCGLISANYLTEDAIELAMQKVENAAMNLIHNQFKIMERKFKNGSLTFKSSKKPVMKSETPLQSGIDALAVVMFSCCERKAKIKPILKITGGYCLFCGVKNYEVE